MRSSSLGGKVGFIDVLRESKRVKLFFALVIVVLVVTVVTVTPLLLGITTPYTLVIPPIAIITAVTTSIILSILSYRLRKVIIERTNDSIKVTLVTKGGTIKLRVKDFKVINTHEVLKFRVIGTQAGNIMYGLFKGPLGYVEAFATSDRGVLLIPSNGVLKYFVAIDNVDEVISCLISEECRYREIYVR